MRSIIFALAMLPGLFLVAQSSPRISVVTSSACLTDINNVPIVRGSLIVQPPFGVGVGGSAGGLTTSSTVHVDIINGALNGNLALPNPALTSPQGIGYTFTIVDLDRPGRTPWPNVNITTTGSAPFDLCHLPAGSYTAGVPQNFAPQPSTVAIGTVTTLPAGSQASVTNAGTPSAAVLDFGIPAGSGNGTGGGNGLSAYELAQGQGFSGTLSQWLASLVGAAGPQGTPGTPGAPGAPGTSGTAATIAVGSATALAAGATPTVTNSGTSSAATFNFGIPAGPQGAQGSPGAPGTAATIAAGTATALANGASPTVTNSGTSSAAVFNFGIPAGPQGAQGSPGTAATIAAGTATALANGSSPTVTNSGTSSAAVFNFGIPAGPQGTQGSPGTAATIAAGTATALANGSSPTVTNSGTSSAAVFNFGIPAGPQGTQGSPGTAATIAAGTATALPNGATPTVTNSGTSSAAIFNFGIPAGPQGSKGNPGTAATVSVGTATALASGATPTVTNSGTSSAAVLNFGIPAGAQGATGPTGLEGNPVSIKSSAYTATSSDFAACNDIVYNGATATLTLPSTIPTPNGVCLMLTVLGTSTITVNPNGLTLDGNASNWVITNTAGTVQGFKIVSDGGANYYSARGQSSASSAGVGAVISWPLNSSVGASTNFLAAPFLSSLGTISQESRYNWVSPVAGTLKNFYLWVNQANNAQTSTGSLVCTVRLNGTSTAISVTIAASATVTTAQSDTLHTQTIAVGDKLTLGCTNNGTATSLQLANATAVIQ